MRCEFARRPAPHAKWPRTGRYAAHPILRIIGATGGALGASVAGRDDIAIGLLGLTTLTLVIHLIAAILRDQRFEKIASKPRPNPQILRELNIREAIRSGQLSSGDAASVLAKRTTE